MGVYILIAVSLSIAPTGSAGFNQDNAPLVSMQEFGNLSACQSAASAIRLQLSTKQNGRLQLICTKKG